MSKRRATKKSKFAEKKIHGVKAGREKIYGRKNQFPSGVTLLLLLIVSLWVTGQKRLLAAVKGLIDGGD